MKTRSFAIFGLALLTLAGCRVDPAIPILERELFRKEREIDELKMSIEDLQDTVQCQERRLARAREEGEGEPTPRHKTPSGDLTPPTSEMPNPTDRPPPSLTNPGSPPSEDNFRVPADLQKPSRTHPAPSREGPSWDHRRSPAPLKVDAAKADSLASAVPFTPTAQSRQVASITINGNLTCEVSDDGRPGRRGLLVVVEPRDAANRTIDASAELNVAVFDPALDGEAARVARWDFRAADVATSFRRIGSHRAIYLTAPWPGEAPKHARLMLYVRYVTADGRRLETNQWIDIAPPAEKTTQWRPIETPRTAYPPRDAEPLRTAARPADAMPDRPVWSPERR
jgi:hypothetical protein